MRRLIGFFTPSRTGRRDAARPGLRLTRHITPPIIGFGHTSLPAAVHLPVGNGMAMDSDGPQGPGELAVGLEPTTC